MPIGRRAQLGISRLIDFDDAPAVQRDGRVREICVRQNAVDVIGRRRQRLRIGQQLFLGIAEGVSRAPENVAEQELVGP